CASQTEFLSSGSTIRRHSQRVCATQEHTPCRRPAYSPTALTLLPVAETSWRRRATETRSRWFGAAAPAAPRRLSVLRERMQEWTWPRMENASLCIGTKEAE